MISGMGLALGIDYSLFVVSATARSAVSAATKLTSIGTVGSTACRAVLFSGSAFVLAMVGMVPRARHDPPEPRDRGDPRRRRQRLAALTLLPAVLALLGDRVNALRVPWLGRRVERSAGAEGRVWSRVVRSVTAAPWLATVLSVGFLVAAALPILTDRDRG
jgi:RND superfamily putative drug exporter